MRTKDAVLFDVEMTRYDGHVELRLSGELDVGTAESLRPALQQANDAGVDIIVDLSALQFIDSTGIHALVMAYKRGRANGRHLTLRAPTAHVRRVLELVGLDQVFTIC